jgi:hypothetical protein
MEGAVNCEVCGIPGGENKLSEDAQAWDWFTGYLDRTVHFCPIHKGSAKREELFRLSKIKKEAAHAR